MRLNVPILLVATAALLALGGLAWSRPALHLWDTARGAVPNPLPVRSFGQLCGDIGYKSPDAGVDWGVTLPPGTYVELQALAANISYRTSFDLPDAGSTAVAFASDKSVVAGVIKGGYLPYAAAMPDGGVPLLIHLSAADLSAGAWPCP